ncbi:tryptophan synthase subunit alpha [Quadrisphaera setariae]|uniref:tryptophan synthase subunit alpha n=1 Tax=Quadrisphaera setariae TaxID=2593304 RepID=UPI0021038D2D|nr:tryptophan synthase subunit alpha [Quadrisphaera setariae]
MSTTDLPAASAGADTTAPVPAGLSSASALDAARAAGRSALVGYLPAGFPDRAGCVDALRASVAAGLDVIELGLPYSDPVMDGPVIQAAAETALRGGTRIRHVLESVEQLASAPDGERAPVLVMSYWAPVLRYGVAAFARDLASAGGAGLITPDLVPDEAGDWIAASDEHGLERVFLVAPSSTPARLASTAAACRGWTYAASTMGVTGARTSVGSAAEGLVAAARGAGAERVCVGLGVSTGEQAAEVGAYADGVIVGSALVRALSDDGVAGLERVVRDLAAGVAGARG